MMAGTAGTAEVQTPNVVVESPNEAYVREVDAFMGLVAAKTAERDAALTRRDEDPEAWAQAKAEFAAFRTGLRQLNPERAARDAAARRAALQRKIALATAELEGLN